MGLCLGYESALRYWLTKRGDEALPEAATAGAFRQAEATSALVKEGALPFAPERGHPLHLVVCDQALKHVVKDAQVHVCQVELPNGSFYRLAGGNIVSSPELTFLQMAASSNLWELIEIGNYLCSTFSIGDEGRGYTGSRGQLMSLEQLDLFLSALPPYARGVRKARRAASEVVELTASPMGRSLQCTTALPRTRAGEGPSSFLPTKSFRSTSTRSASFRPAIWSETCSCPSTKATLNSIARSFTPGSTVSTTRRRDATFSRPCRSKPSRQHMARWTP